MQKSRDYFIDQLRGYAMFMMFFAHLLPIFNKTGIDSMFVYRIISSVAAPLFLFLVGYNFSLNQDFKSVIKKVLVFLLFAGLIDVFLWGILPFYSFDVLYCIAFGYFALYFFNQLRNSLKLSVLIIFVLGAFIFQFYYSQKLNEPGIFQFNDFNYLVLLQNLIFNGWFPIFPWLFFIFLGSYVRFFQFNLFRKWLHIVSLISFFVCSYLVYFKGAYMREMAVEIFYPANFLYLVLACSWLYFVWNLKNYFRQFDNNLIAEFGKYGLLFYVLHLTILHFVTSILPFTLSIIPNPHIALLILYACLLGILFLGLKSIDKFKKSSIYQTSARFLIVKMLFH